MSNKFIRFVHPILRSEIIINEQIIKLFNIDVFRYAKTIMISLSKDRIKEWLFLFNFPENEGDTLILSKKNDFFDKSCSNQFINKLILIPHILYNKNLTIRAFCNQIHTCRKDSPHCFRYSGTIKNDLLTNSIYLYNIDQNSEIIWANNDTKFIYFDKPDISSGYKEEGANSEFINYTLKDFLDNVTIHKDNPNAIVQEVLYDILLSKIGKRNPLVYIGKEHIDLCYSYRNQYLCRLIIKPINSKFQIVFGKLRRVDSHKVYFHEMCSTFYNLAPNISVIIDRNIHREAWDTLYITEFGQNTLIVKDVNVIDVKSDYLTFFDAKSMNKFIYTSYDRQILPLETELIKRQDNYPWRRRK